jgi:membrane fusion protein (multidrug efflux system)
MSTYKKIAIIFGIIILLIVGIIVGRIILNNIIQKKINQINPTEVIAANVKKYNFYEKIETFGTALANQSFSIRIRKEDLISSLDFDKNLLITKGQLIAQLKNEKIIAPFAGKLGIREISPGILQGAESIIATLDDISEIKIDIRIPEIYLNILKKNLNVKITTENLNETFNGTIETVSSRVDPSSRSVLAQVKIKNSSNKLIPGMLLNTEIIYNEIISLGVPEESVVQQGNTAVVYKIIDNQTVARTEVKTGIRSLGFVQIISGLTEGEQIVVQGVSKVRDKSKIKLISK